MNINIEDIKILEFYPYRTWVKEPIAFYDKANQKGDLGVKVLCDNIQNFLDFKGFGSYVGNKTAYKVLQKSTGKIYYIGIFDFEYTIGLSVKQENDIHYTFEKDLELL